MLKLAERFDCTATGKALWDNNEPTTYGERVYTEADCWALAWHLSTIAKRNGFTGEIYTLGRRKHWVHVVVKIDDDSYLDVRGLSSGDELAHEWWGESLHEVPAHGLTSLEDYQTFLDTDFYEFPCGHYEANQMAIYVADKHLPWI